MTWEEAVRWYRAQPGGEQAVRDNYFDLPVLPAAQRFYAGEEFQEMRRLLGPGGGRAALDFGAGNGIVTYALARDGWRATAYEPDPSDEVGAGAIRALQRETALPIDVAPATGGLLPFVDGSFQAAIARQVLHHVPELSATLKELHRILSPGGALLAVREHVVSDERQLVAFREQHPLHKHYGGENAWRLEEYRDAARQAGFVEEAVWGQAGSILNFFPGTEAGRRDFLATQLAGGRTWAARCLRALGPLEEPLLKLPAARCAAHDETPGRLYSFLWRRT